MERDTFRGLVAAPNTALTPDGGLNLGMIERQAASLVDQNVVGAFICGTTGEGLSLTTEERMSVASRWAEVAGDSLHLIVHVGHNSIADARSLAQHAVKIGADAIAAMPPSFIKPASVQDAVEFCGVVAAAADPLPFYYYHIPSMSGVNISMLRLMELAVESIPTFRGIKFTHSDLIEYRRCVLAAPPKVQVLWGFDELLLPALAVGAKAAVGSTYNFAADIYNRMLDAFDQGDMDEARACTDQSRAVIDQLIKFGTLRAGKAYMKILGIDCGPPRLPLKPLTPEEFAEVEKAVEEIGLPSIGRSMRSV